MDACAALSLCSCGTHPPTHLAAGLSSSVPAVLLRVYGGIISRPTLAILSGVGCWVGCWVLLGVGCWVLGWVLLGVA
jgi:hypothetical protein